MIAIINKVSLLLVLVHLNYGIKHDAESKILGGYYGKIDEFPFAAGLEYLAGYGHNGYYIGFWLYACGGTILDEYWIITTTSCLPDYDRTYRFVVGVEYISLIWENGEIRVIEKFIHSNIAPTSNDIALALLREPLEFSSKVNKIFVSSQKNASDGITAGWGRTEGSWYRRSLWFKYIEVKIDCQDKTPQNQPGQVCNINAASGERNKGPCDGDIGDGVYIDIYGKKYLHGIINSMDETCDSSTMILIPPFKAFISEAIGPGFGTWQPPRPKQSDHF